MDEIVIESQLNIPELDVSPEERPAAIQALITNMAKQGIKAKHVDDENGIPVFALKAPKEALESFIAKEFEGGEYNLDDFVIPDQGFYNFEEPGDIDGEATAEGTDADKDPMAEDTEADVVDTSDGTNPSEEDTIVKTLEGLDEQVRNRILARFSGAAPKTGDTSVEGTALAKVIKGLKY